MDTRAWLRMDKGYTGIVVGAVLKSCPSWPTSSIERSLHDVLWWVRAFKTNVIGTTPSFFKRMAKNASVCAA